MANHCVYTHCRADGTPFYVGLSNDLVRPFKMKRNEWHDRIVVKEGKENVVVNIIPCHSAERAKQLEIWLIRIGRKMGVELTNHTDGGDGVRNPTPEVRHKIGSAMRGKRFTITDDHKAKIGAAHKGKKRSEQARENMRKGHVGQVLSDEHKAKIGAASKAVWDSWTEEKKTERANKLRASWTPERRAAASARTKARHAANRLKAP